MENYENFIQPLLLGEAQKLQKIKPDAQVYFPKEPLPSKVDSIENWNINKIYTELGGQLFCTRREYAISVLGHKIPPFGYDYPIGFNYEDYCQLPYMYFNQTEGIWKRGFHKYVDKWQYFVFLIPDIKIVKYKNQRMAEEILQLTKENANLREIEKLYSSLALVYKRKFQIEEEKEKLRIEETELLEKLNTLK